MHTSRCFLSPLPSFQMRHAIPLNVLTASEPLARALEPGFFRHSHTSQSLSWPPVQRHSVVIYLPDFLRLSSLQHLAVCRVGFPALAPRAGCGTPISTITFGSIVGNAEHLAVLGRAIATLAPC